MYSKQMPEITSHNSIMRPEQSYDEEILSEVEKVVRRVMSIAGLCVERHPYPFGALYALCLVSKGKGFSFSIISTLLQDKIMISTYCADRWGLSQNSEKGRDAQEFFLGNPSLFQDLFDYFDNLVSCPHILKIRQKAARYNYRKIQMTGMTICPIQKPELTGSASLSQLESK